MITVGCLAIALVILGANFRGWWKSGRDPKKLAPFGAGFTLGALATICTGGVLGLLAGCTTDITNAAGSRAVPGATGTGERTLAGGALGALTEGGGLIVFLLAAGVIVVWKSAGDDVKRRMTGGMLCGSTLCVTAGVAGALTWLPELANSLGDGIIAMVEGGAVL